MKNQLKTLLEQSKWTITEAVIEEALSYSDPKAFFEDLLEHGCVSWMVSSLIYYKDTYEFFEKHYEEIEQMRSDLIDEWIEVMIPSWEDLKNYLSWLSFEEKAREIYRQIENKQESREL